MQMASFGILMIRPHEARSRCRNKSNFARPYICLFSSFKRCTWPSVHPLLNGVLRAAVTTAWSSRRLRANRCIAGNGLALACVIMEALVEAVHTAARACTTYLGAAVSVPGGTTWCQQGRRRGRLYHSGDHLPSRSRWRNLHRSGATVL